MNAEDFWIAASELPVIDVRSPGEFQAGHIPGAVNVPLFTDEQRAEIGTAYKRKGRLPAIQLGLERVSPRLPEMIQAALDLASDEGQLLIHCWRGGMRSQAFAKFVELVDLKPKVLKGGYKSFRNLVHSRFSFPWRLNIISGLTGAGKTRVLQALSATGEQVIDLESLANHRGSAFGGIDQGPQPSTEQFENRLFQSINAFDAKRPIWIEDEGGRIGSVVVPPELFSNLRASPAIFIECDQETRIRNLLQDYGTLSIDGLRFAVQRISKRLDGKLVKLVFESIDSGDLKIAVRIVLDYYDKTYERAKARIPRAIFAPCSIEGLAEAEIVQKIVRMAENFHPFVSERRN